MKNLATPIYEDLKEKIASNLLVPHKAFTEVALASQYGVSRNTAKKALMMLEGDGLVVIEKNKTARINDRSLEEVSSLLELRGVLEAYIVKNVVKSITDKQIAELEALLREMKELVDKRELLVYLQCDVRFHSVLYDACTNPTAIKMTTQLKTQLRKYSSRTILIPGRDIGSYNEHVAIFEAVKKRDAEAAGDCMLVHISNLQKTFTENAGLLL